MTQQNFPRNRVFPPRRADNATLVWATTRINLETTLAGQAGQKAINLNVALEAALGRQLVGATILRIRGRILFESGTTGLAETTNFMIGAGLFTEGVDEADFPDMELGSASWMLYETFVFKNTTAGAGTVVSPNEQYVIGTKAMRKQDGNQTKLSFVVQNKQAGDVLVSGQVRVLAKVP